MPDTRIPRFGSYLKARREARGLTQRALAEQIGVTPQRISLVELNQAMLSLLQCTAAAKKSIADLYKAVNQLTFRADRLEGSVAIVEGHVSDVLSEMRNNFEQMQQRTDQRFDALEALLNSRSGSPTS